MRFNELSIAIASVVTVTLAACAAEPDTMAADASGKADEQLVCVREKQTGSHIPRKVCRTAAQIENEREAAREAASRQQQQSSIQQSGTTGN